MTVDRKPCMILLGFFVPKITIATSINNYHEIMDYEILLYIYFFCLRDYGVIFFYIYIDNVY